MRAPPVSFKAEIAAYIKKHCPPPEDLALLKRWEEKDLEWKPCWEKIQEKLPAEAMPTAEEFIYLVLQQRDAAKCFGEIKRRTPTLAEAKRRAAAHVRGKSEFSELAKVHAELAREYEALAKLNQMLARLGRQKKNIERKQFTMAWQDKFFELCGWPLNEVVLVMTLIVYGGNRDIGAIKGTRRATTRHGRKG